MADGEKAAAFVGENGSETIKMIERDPRQFEDVYTVVFARLCNGCKCEGQKRQTFISNLKPETQTLLLLQSSIRYPELATLLRNSVTPSRLVDFSLSKPALPTFAMQSGLPPHIPRGIPRLEAEVKRKTASSSGSYEEMISMGILRLDQGEGVKPKLIYDWMETYFNDLPDNFRASASQALKKGVDKGRFLKRGPGTYELNGGYEKPLPARKKRKRHGEIFSADGVILAGVVEDGVMSEASEEEGVGEDGDGDGGGG
ncbi:hypothetical protein HDU67_006664 [Dinochytrium kinnereticum]|nr:hypothetical protein HDU67_006664 [Dinochytrium kinnereticum]